MRLRAPLLFGPTPFGAGCLLAWEEHEQGQHELDLPVAQLELDCQLKHGFNLA